MGSHTTLLLLQRGYDVIIYDSFFNSSINVITSLKYFLDKENIKYNLKYINADIRDKTSLDNVFKESIAEHKPIEAVFHFAGLKSVYESVSNPLDYWDVNVCGTRKLLEVMNKNQCFKLVFSSSATIYGLSKAIPIKEDENICPQNPYGATKVAIEKMLNDLYQSNCDLWKISSLRYFNPVGAHPSGLIGEDPIGTPSNLFPYINQVAIGRRKILNVFGNDWDTYDGSGVRDYIHIIDLGEGHIAALEYLDKNKPCIEYINLGSGKGYSVFEIINEFQNSNGCEIPYEIKGRRDGDIGICIAEISKAKDLLGWEPMRNLKEMCMDSWNWQSKNPQGYKSNNI